jgi:hypothetical protein
MIEPTYPLLVRTDLVYIISAQRILDTFVNGEYIEDDMLKRALVSLRNGSNEVEVSDWNTLSALGLITEEITESASRNGVYHYTYYRKTSGDGRVKYSCTCEGFQYHGNCKH